MGIKREQREHKEVKTRPLKQEIENLKLDLMDAQDEYDTLYNNMIKCVQLLNESTNVSNGKLKYDSSKLVELMTKIYKLDGV